MGAKIIYMAIDRDVVENLKRMFKNEDNTNSAVRNRLVFRWQLFKDDNRF